MDRSTLLSSLTLLTVVLAAAVAQEKYSDKYDHLDVAKILADDKQRNEYYQCIMDIGPCSTEEMKFLRENAAEAFVTRCLKCTAAQKDAFDKIIAWYTTNSPEEWSPLMKKLMDEAKKKNIKPVFR